MDGLPAPLLYLMVTPGAPVRLHRIRNDQLYHYYLGDPIVVLMLRVDGTTERVVVGPDVGGGVARAASNPRQHFPHSTRDWAPPLVSRCEYRMARRRAR